MLADGKRLRSYQSGVVKIVKTNKEASIPDYTEFGVDIYQIGGAVFMYVPSGEGGGGGEENVIEKVKVNHVALSVDTTDKSVDIDSVPASIVIDDSTHRFVSDTDKTNWNSKTSNVGTITGIMMNGSSMGTSGNVDLGTVLTSHQDITSKADKVQSATDGHLAGLDGSGNLTDAGYAIWVGTESAYNDILSKDDYTLYFIKEAIT